MWTAAPREGAQGQSRAHVVIRSLACPEHGVRAVADGVVEVAQLLGEQVLDIGGQLQVRRFHARQRLELRDQELLGHAAAQVTEAEVVAAAARDLEADDVLGRDTAVLAHGVHHGIADVAGIDHAPDRRDGVQRGRRVHGEVAARYLPRRVSVLMLMSVSSATALW